MEQMPKKISQIKLSNFTYDIDVANNLKATKLIGEQLTKVAPVEAILKPDGQYYFFDENNKISSHYISDTILGQLKFGGTIAYDGADIFSINPSTLFYERALEFEATKESPSGESFSNPILVPSYGELGSTLAILGDWGNGSSPLFNNDLVNLEGFYFILTTPSDPYTGNSPEEMLIPKSNIGDWWVICGGKIEKIDNTDTITHIADANTSLLSIEGSGLKLNGITAVHPDYSDEVIDQVNIDAPISVSYGMTYIGSDIINRYGGKIQTGQDNDSFKSTLTPGRLNLKSDTAHIKVTQSTEDLGTHTEITPTQFSVKTINPENGVAEANTFMAPGEISTSGSISGQEVHAELKMTAPTISDTTDKTQVVNLDYFENNATKVDWENIDSEVHVINNHSVEIDGGLVVHCNSDITRVDISSLGDEQTCAYEPYVQSDGTASWYNDSNLTQPYWLRFPITAGYKYEVTGKPEYTPSFFKNASGAGHLVVTAASEGAALNIVEYSYAASAQDEEYTTAWYGKGTIYFTADITGYAYIPTSDSVMYHGNSISTSKYNITEIQGSAPRVKIEGDLEITGDLSFGADSHLVFGTIEGTDFIADYAKVKNAPVEDDDVVNLKTLKEWVPSTSGKEKLYEANISLNNYTTGTTVWACEPVAGTYYFEFTGANGDVIKTHKDFTPTGLDQNAGVGTIIDEWTVSACSPPAIGTSSNYPITLIESSIALNFFVDFCGCESFGNNTAVNFVIYRQATPSGGSADISNYQGNAKINGNLEVTGNLSFDGDLEMSSIEAQSIKINGKRVLTEDDLANLVAYPAAEDYTF